MYDRREGKGVLLWVKQDKGRLGRNYNYRASTFLGRGDRRDGGESLAKSNRLRIQSVENRAQKGHKWRRCTKWTRRYIPRQELYSHLDYLLLQNVLANSGMRFLLKSPLLKKFFFKSDFPAACAIMEEIV